MYKCFAFIAVAATFVLPMSAHAQAAYGMAGCGLGAILMGSEGSQTSAATSNGTLYNQSFAITFGTSHCADDGGASSASLDQEAFIRNNYANVMHDAATGQGEYLSAFATILGCDAEAHTTFFKLAQDKHGHIFTDKAGPTEVLDSVKTEAGKHTALKASCARI